jgi:DNA-binding NarL/FixJ family response regulator
MHQRRIMIIDDHPIVRQGLAQLIGQELDLVVCGEAAEVDEAKQLLARVRPDLVLLDISLKESNGIDLIKFIRTNLPSVFVLVLSLHDASAYAERVLQSGARGFVSKAEAVENVVVAIREVMAGGIYVSPPTRHSVKGLGSDGDEPSQARRRASISSLSDRELELFHLLGNGMNNAAIAASMKLSVKTVETYKAHIKRKLGLNDGTELIEQAVKWNIGNWR